MLSGRRRRQTAGARPVHVRYPHCLGGGERHDLIPGHEVLGVVDEVGDEVRDFKPGDRVIVPAFTPDWETEAAQRGYPPQTGSRSEDGGFRRVFPHKPD